MEFLTGDYKNRLAKLMEDGLEFVVIPQDIICSHCGAIRFFRNEYICSHLYCRDDNLTCTKNGKKNPECTIKSKDIVFAICNSVVYCPNKSFGCKEKVTVSRLLAHLDECAFCKDKDNGQAELQIPEPDVKSTSMSNDLATCCRNFTQIKLDEQLLKEQKRVTEENRCLSATVTKLEKEKFTLQKNIQHFKKENDQLLKDVQKLKTENSQLSDLQTLRDQVNFFASKYHQMYEYIVHLEEQEKQLQQRCQQLQEKASTVQQKTAKKEDKKAFFKELKKMSISEQSQVPGESNNPERPKVTLDPIQRIQINVFKVDNQENRFNQSINQGESRDILKCKHKAVKGRGKKGLARANSAKGEGRNLKAPQPIAALRFAGGQESASSFTSLQGSKPKRVGYGSDDQWQGGGREHYKNRGRPNDGLYAYDEYY